MLDETCSFESCSHACKLRRWGKKKSTGDPVKKEESPAPKEAASSPDPQPKEAPPTNITVEASTPSVVNEPAPTEPPKISPAVVAPQSTKPKETPSLFRKKDDVKTQSETEVVVEKKSEAFTEDALLTAWKSFAEHRMSLNMGDAEKLVLSRTLSKEGENDVLIGLGSQLEVSILEKFEQDLVQFLRKELANDLILLKKGVQEQKESQKLYTSKDKFEFMAAQNPALKELKDRLGLDFEY